MTKNEMIIEILLTHSCLTSKEIANFIWRQFEENFTPQSIAGAMRSFYTAGIVGKGKNVSGHTVYWLTNGTGSEVKLGVIR